MANVKFDRTQSQSAALGGDTGTIFFTNDTKEIIMNGDSYTGAKIDSTQTDAVAKTKKDGVVYLTSDTNYIYKDGIQYGGGTSGGGRSCSLTAAAVTDITTDPDFNTSTPIEKLADNNTVFYPVTHVDAVIGLDTKVDVTLYDEDLLAISGALNFLNSQIIWQDE